MLAIIHDQLTEKLSREHTTTQKQAYISYYESIAIIENDQNHILQAQFYQAKYFSAQSSLNKANSILKRLIPLFLKNENWDYLHAALNLLAQNKWEQGNIEECITQIGKIASIPYPNKTHQATTQLIKIKLLILFKAHEKALANCKQTLRRLNVFNENEQSVYMQALFQLVDLYLLKGSFRNAKCTLIKMVRASKYLCVNELNYKLLYTIGSYYFQLNQFDLASKYVTLAFQNCQRNGFQQASLKCMQLLAEIHLANNKITEAEKSFLHCFNNYSPISKDKFISVLHSLVDIYKLIGNKQAQERFEIELAMHLS